MVDTTMDGLAWVRKQVEQADPADYVFDLAGRGDQPKSAGTGPDQQL